MTAVTTTELIRLVNKAIDSLELPETPARLYQPVKYILGNAGKRLRPVLFLHAIQLFSSLKDRYLKPAVGIEIFHNFTLIHDDIMDKAEVRRNRLTVHKKWDENVGILSGDAAMIIATQYFLELPVKVLKPVLSEFNKMALEICEGQQYDMDYETCDSVSIDEYLKMIRLKTAVFLGSALKMGAITGGASDEQQALLYEAGINFGLAFQLQDDYLDTFGDIKTFGKKPGGDILEKKKTFLLINTLENACVEQKDYLQTVLNDVTMLPDKKIEAVKNVYSQLGVDTFIQKTIKSYYTNGFELINKVAGNEIVKEELQSFFKKMNQRIS